MNGSLSGATHGPVQQRHLCEFPSRSGPFRPIGHGMKVLCSFWIVVSVLVPSGASADIYKWTDAEDRVHFTQDLGQVPPEHRSEARLSRHRVLRHDLTTYESTQAPTARVRASLPGSGRAFEIPFEMRGNSMWVYVRINDRASAPFIVDTGASDVAVPAHVAEQAGIVVDADTPLATYQTANGMVQKPIVQLDSVQVGDVRVEGVRGSISDNLPVGLLGGSFFNNFTFQVDPAAQIITLMRNASVRSGVSEKQWRQRFAAARGRLAALDEYLKINVFARSSRRLELEHNRETLENQLDELEREADRADVPQAWRAD